MTSQDTNFIKTIGNTILELTAVVIIHTLLYGIFFLLMCISTVILIHRGLKTRAQWMMLIITVICFALFSLSLTVNVMGLIIVVKSILVDNITVPQKKLYNIKVKDLLIIEEVIGEFLPIISDMIVVWRAWVIFPFQRKLMIGPISFLICTVAITILHLLSVYNLVPALRNNTHTIDGMWIGVYATSIATNLTATLLISYNLWNHGKKVSGNNRRQRSRSQGEKILAVLVESGAIYCVIQAVTLVLLITKSDKRHGLATIYAFDTFCVVYAGASAMYPVIVVVLVRLQLSFEHTYGFSLVSQAQGHDNGTTPHPLTIGQLKFASVHSNSSMNQENEEVLEEGQGV